jgi:phage tail protein X
MIMYYATRRDEAIDWFCWKHSPPRRTDLLCCLLQSEALHIVMQARGQHSFR